MFILGPYIGVGLPLPVDSGPWTPEDLFNGLPGYWQGSVAPDPAPAADEPADE